MHAPVTPYSGPARWIHWLTALAILTVIPAGLVMMRLPSGPAQDQLFDLHKSVGFLILCLAVLRVAVRLAYGAPPPVPNRPRWQRATSNAVHHALYGLIFVMPLLGWAGSNAYGAPVSVFGLFTLPDLVAKDQALSDRLNGAHQALGYVTAGLVSLHILAGLWHGIVQRDGVLSRMIPALSRRGS
ncbi:cytochrome b [Aquabacter sp. L1I39]|uniref:cytochrome b n=1 Tax=Aquabacter sp. L1I39 TaxID=2820278 RepID=UPI001AD9984A|nr:cytochrome b [Aquabacter sp. L1I39]QTL01958.1 cytochrome b [Aquabacter sp. L1I39]